MSKITSGMSTQYADSSKLAARARLARDFSSAQTPWFTWAAQQLPVGANADILDVGCGPAWFWPEAVAALPPGITLTLLDQSAGMVDEALARCRPLPFARVSGVTADATKLPFADGAFDAVIAMHVLYHVTDQERAIEEFYRVLKPGGALLVTTNGAENMRELYRLAAIFGGGEVDPASVAFGFERAQQVIRDRFGNATLAVHPQTMHVTDPEVVFLALTSYPPGETAPAEQQRAFRTSTDAAFAAGGGALDVTKQAGAIVGRKPG